MLGRVLQQFLLRRLVTKVFSGRVSSSETIFLQLQSNP